MAVGVADAHALSGPPATAVGAAAIFIVLVAVAAVHPAGASVVKVNVTVPEKLAAGVYVTVAGVAVCAVELSVPPPAVIDQAPVVALPPTLAPLNVMAVGVADWHALSGPPATAVGAAAIVIVLVAVAGVHPAGASVVKVNVTVPEKLAAGVYVTVAGVAVCAVELSVPPPAVIDQAPVVALPPTLAPLNVMAVGVADAHALSGPPAVAVGAAAIVIVLVSVAGVHPAGALLVRVKVTVPEKFAAGV